MFFGSHFGVRLHWRIVFFGSGSQGEVFLVSLTDRTLARNFINEFSHHSTVAAHSARAIAASLNRFYWEPTGGRCVFECKCGSYLGRMGT